MGVVSRNNLGANLDKVPGMTLIEDDQSHKIKQYKRSDEKLFFGDIPVKEIIYESFNGKFYTVSAKVESFIHEEKLSMAVTEYYGCKPTKTDHYYFWYGKTPDGEYVNASIYRNSGALAEIIGYDLSYNVTYSPILKQKQDFDDAQKKEKANALPRILNNRFPRGFSMKTTIFWAITVSCTLTYGQTAASLPSTKNHSRSMPSTTTAAVVRVIYDKTSQPASKPSKIDSGEEIIYKGIRRNKVWIDQQYKKFNNKIAKVGDQYIDIVPDILKGTSFAGLANPGKFVYAPPDTKVFQVISKNEFLAITYYDDVIFHVTGVDTSDITDYAHFSGPLICVGTYRYTTAAGGSKQVGSYKFYRPLTARGICGCTEARF